MGKRFDSLVVPGGKSRAFTLSYDDGVVQDRRLAEIFRERGLKCTFNIGSGLFGHKDGGSLPGKPPLDLSKLSLQEAKTVYAGHEIAGHGLFHSDLSGVGTPLAMYEVVEDKRRLEELTRKPLKMFAYPFGTHNADTRELLRLAGYQGARTVASTHAFRLPEDFLTWNPTCHHDDPELMTLAGKFLEQPPFLPSLFYVWGHAYEFDANDNWQTIEKLADFMAAHGDAVWFATNGEIIDYVNAYRRLEYSADGTYVNNPSAVDVTIRTSMFAVETIPAGKCAVIAPTPL